jgi:hypothetical protein
MRLIRGEAAGRAGAVTSARPLRRATAVSCRACGADLLSVLDLGEQPVAHALRAPGEVGCPEDVHPLRLALCPSCSLLQTLEDVDPADPASDDGGAAELDRLSRNGGTGTVDLPYVRHLLDAYAFDTIHHARPCYFSLTAAMSFLAGRGLFVEDAARTDHAGHTLRVQVRRGRFARQSRAVGALLEDERKWGVAEPRAYIGFARELRAAKDALAGLLERLHESGDCVAAYGPAARVSTLVNSFGLGDLLDFAVDPDPAAHGRFIPGAELEIVAPEALVDDGPDYLLLLPGTDPGRLAAEQRVYRARGGRFIVPSPWPAIR